MAPSRIVPMEKGASAEAIARHYDVSNEFYSLWLDRTMTYSAGVWDCESDLDVAQERKLDLHIAWAGAGVASSVLDVGCGWGSLLERLVNVAGVRHAVGLTLSEEQVRYVRQRGLDGVDVRRESWTEHRPSRSYDAVISIGALEHFAKPETSPEMRVETYRRFFASCREWLRPGGRMSLQTIAYARGEFTSGAIASIFPESDLPRLAQIVSSVEGLFHVAQMRSDPLDYAKTCDVWRQRLIERRSEAVALVGQSVVRDYEAFLAAAIRGFQRGVFTLLRMQLVRQD